MAYTIKLLQIFDKMFSCGFYISKFFWYLMKSIKRCITLNENTFIIMENKSFVLQAYHI